MTRNAPKILLLLVVSAAAAAADDPPAPTVTPAPASAEPQTTDASATILAAKPNAFFQDAPADSDGRARSVSPSVAQALSEGLPRYSAPTPTPTPAAEPQDMRDIDRPRNEIKRLPKFVVEGSRPPIFRKQDLFTTTGLSDLEFKAHPGLLVGNILGLNSGVAAQMLQDDQRLENMADLKDTAHAMMLGGDISEGKYILEKSQETYMRTNDDWMTNAPGAPGDWIQ